MFLSVAQVELGNGLFLQTYETDPSFPMSFAKIRNSNTTFIQSNFSHLAINHGVFIDVFALDGYPAQSRLKRLTKIVIEIYISAILKKFKIKSTTGGTTLKYKIKDFLTIVLSTVLPLYWLRSLLDDLISKHDYESCDVVINWLGAWGLKEAVPRKYFDAGRRVEFEDTTAIIPSLFDEYLTSLYGDYMTPPLFEERIRHHFTDVINLENSYTKYIGEH